MMSTVVLMQRTRRFAQLVVWSDTEWSERVFESEGCVIVGKELRVIGICMNVSCGNSYIVTAQVLLCFCEV